MARAVKDGSGFGSFIVGRPVAVPVLGSGRRLRDDVVDFEASVVTDGAINIDSVPDDSGARISDGNMGTDGRGLALHRRAQPGPDRRPRRKPASLSGKAWAESPGMPIAASRLRS